MNKNRILLPLLYSLCLGGFLLLSSYQAQAQITIAIDDLIGRYQPTTPTSAASLQGHQPESGATITYVTVYNSRQQMVYSQAVPYLPVVTLPALPAGIYTIQVMTTQGLYTIQAEEHK